MKRLYLLLAMVFIASCLAVPAFGQGVTVLCVGQESGGTGMRLYQYDILTNVPITGFEVGTHDGNTLNYTNWLMPAGYLRFVHRIYGSDLEFLESLSGEVSAVLWDGFRGERVRD